MNNKIIDLLADSRIFKDSSESSIDLDSKFILVSTKEILYLVLGPLREYPYHANLLAYLAENEQIPGSWVKKPDQFSVLPTQAKINGGGWFRFEFKNRILRAMGVSTAYGRFDKELLQSFFKSDQFYPNMTKTIID